MKIINAPDSVLSEKAKPVLIQSGQPAKIDPEVLRLIDNMRQTLIATKDPEGVGLAAPQVGKSLSIFIIKPSPKSPIKVFINPVILKTFNPADQNTEKNEQNHKACCKHCSDKHPQKLEGCLSLPSIWGEVKRARVVVVKYFDENGKMHKRMYQGLAATIIQHECDHLNGTLFPKRVLEQKGTLYKSHKNEKGQDEFEEITI